jgi:hypothetical protein
MAKKWKAEKWEQTLLPYLLSYFLPQMFLP